MVSITVLLFFRL